MTILSAQSIQWNAPLYPIRPRTVVDGVSRGLSGASYDVCLDQDLFLRPGEFKLASTLERFQMPNHIAAVVHDKSTWARRGILVQNTFIDPGFHGFLTLEITSHSDVGWAIREGTGIAQIVFHYLDMPTTPYSGKYRNQERGPVAPRSET